MSKFVATLEIEIEADRLEEALATAQEIVGAVKGHRHEPFIRTLSLNRERAPQAKESAAAAEKAAGHAL